MLRDFFEVLRQWPLEVPARVCDLGSKMQDSGLTGQLLVHAVQADVTCLLVLGKRAKQLPALSFSWGWPRLWHRFFRNSGGAAPADSEEETELAFWSPLSLMYKRMESRACAPLLSLVPNRWPCRLRKAEEVQSCQAMTAPTCAPSLKVSSHYSTLSPGFTARLLQVTCLKYK